MDYTYFINEMYHNKRGLITHMDNEGVCSWFLYRNNLTQFCLADSSIPFFGQVNVQPKVCLICSYYYHLLQKFMYLMQNSEDPDQIPHSAASDLDLHC